MQQQQACIDAFTSTGVCTGKVCTRKGRIHATCELINAKVYLRWCEACEGEHAYLACNEGPVFVRVYLLKVIPENLPHCLQENGTSENRAIT